MDAVKIQETNVQGNVQVVKCVEVWACKHEATADTDLPHNVADGTFGIAKDTKKIFMYDADSDSWV